MIGSLMICMSVVILLIGMLAGIAMGVLQDFALAPAHAHLNLVGGVLLFMFGLYYRLVPAPGPARWRKFRAGSISLVLSCFRRASRSSC